MIAVGHVVAAEDDEVGLVGHDEIDRAGDHLVRDRRAAMEVGQESDAKAGERAGQPATSSVCSVNSIWWRS